MKRWQESPWADGRDSQGLRRRLVMSRDNLKVTHASRSDAILED